jgi:hypothetical protein
MGALSWLKKALEQCQQDGCQTSPKVKDFLNNYDNHIETAKRVLQERQEAERKERSSSEGDR